MKKLVFAIVAVAAVSFASCNNGAQAPAEECDSLACDSACCTEVVEEVVDSALEEVVDSAAELVEEVAEEVAE